MKQVYNPNDDVMHFGYAAQEYTLAPNSTTELEDALAAQAVTACGSWGVCILGSNPEQDKAKAELVYLAANRKWCEQKAADLAARKAKFAGVGLDVKPTEDEVYALAWLHKFGL